MILNVSLNNFYNTYKVEEKDCFLNFIQSGRGTGKTYAYKTKCINDFKKYQNEFVWIRRTQTDLDEQSKSGLFYKDMQEQFPTDTFNIKGGIFTINESPAGYFIPLSCSTKFKSIPYPYVTNIIFDEFIIGKTDPRRYLKNEVIIFLNLISTIVRHRDNCHIYCLGNGDTVDNPYYSYFDIYPVAGQRFVRKGDILIESFKNNNFVDEIKQTRFGKLVANTRFGDYAFENKVLDDTTDNVRPFDKNMTFIYGFIINNKNIGLWVNNNNKLWVSEKIDPNSKNIRMLTDFNNFKFLYDNSNLNCIDLLKFNLTNNLIFFETMMIKRVFIDNMSDII